MPDQLEQTIQEVLDHAPRELTALALAALIRARYNLPMATERAEYSFILKDIDEHKAWIVLEAARGGLPILDKNGLSIGLELVHPSYEKAREVCDYLNANIKYLTTW